MTKWVKEKLSFLKNNWILNIQYLWHLWMDFQISRTHWKFSSSSFIKYHRLYCLASLRGTSIDFPNFLYEWFKFSSPVVSQKHQLWILFKWIFENKQQISWFSLLQNACWFISCHNKGFKHEKKMVHSSWFRFVNIKIYNLDVI